MPGELRAYFFEPLFPIMDRNCQHFFPLLSLTDVAATVGGG